MNEEVQRIRKEGDDEEVYREGQELQCVCGSRENDRVERGELWD